LFDPLAFVLSLPGNLDGKQNIPTSCESFGRIKFS
jgi:hypothetical protein